MSDLGSAVKALKDAKAEPDMDPFTLLTIIEAHLSAALLPTLNEILQDAKLAQDIGWDLIDKVLKYPGCEQCLETIARLGNPREAILKVLEVLERIGTKEHEEDQHDGNGSNIRHDADADTETTFITLLGMLATLHKRIKTKYPSRFLVTTLTTVANAYRPIPGQSAAVINLVQSLSPGAVRPRLPIRHSTTCVSSSVRDGDASRNAPDPEAGEAEDQEHPMERSIQERLLVCFVTCILERYVQANDMEWSVRLWEFYNPERRVARARKVSRLDVFKEDEELLARDAVVGQLAALTRDLGLSSFSPELIKRLCDGPIIEDPFNHVDVDDMAPGRIPLSTGGTICLLAYVVFSSTIFAAEHPTPALYVFPHHFTLMEGYMGDDFGKRANDTPSTVDALVAIALWLKHENRVESPSITSRDGAIVDDKGSSLYMEYLHFLGLTAVFHPHILVRNATTSLAGEILHYDPDDEDRLRVLEDLIENCTFDALRASAVSWLREEIIAAEAKNLPTIFMSADCIDHLQYHLFPNLSLMLDQPPGNNWPLWTTSRLFYHQVANFAFFLFGGNGRHKHLIPKGMGAAVEQRFALPLMEACKRMLRAIRNREEQGGGGTGESGEGLGSEMDLEIVVGVLGEVCKFIDGVE